MGEATVRKFFAPAGGDKRQSDPNAKPDEIRNDPTKGRMGEFLCHNCGRQGYTHVPHAPFYCKKYEDESILTTTFEAWIFFALMPLERPAMISHIKAHTQTFEGRSVEEYIAEYWDKYPDGGIYECICSDLGIEPLR